MSEELKEKRKQHWLPASYLQFFTTDPNEQHREGYLYRISAEGHRQVQVETQGVSKFHYRKQNTHQSEGLFQVLESDYPELIRKAISEERLSSNEQCKLLLSIVALSCRNPSLTNQTGWENWDVFVSLSNSFLANHLGVPPYSGEQKGLQLIANAIRRAQLINPLPLDGMPPDNEFKQMAHILNFVGSTFHVAFIKNLGGKGSLFTSDFPTLFFSLDQLNVPLMLMPVTPSLLAVALDTRFFEVHHNWLSSKDFQLLQEFLLVQANKAFFASAMCENDLHALSEALRDRKVRSKGWVKTDVWQPIMYSYSRLLKQRGGFDFLTSRE